MENLESIDSSPLQNLLGNNEVSLLPESFIATITIGFIVLNVLGILFLIAYIIGLIRKWKVQSAVLHMQKDVAEIKAQLAAKDTTPATSSAPRSSSPLIAPEPTRSDAQPDKA